MATWMLVILDDPKREATPEQMGEAMAAMGAFGGRHGDKIVGGSPLKPMSESVRVTAGDGEPVVTDGPFAETKEMLAGYFVFEVDTRDEMIEIARDCPHLAIGPVEIREVLPIGGPPR